MKALASHVHLVLRSKRIQVCIAVAALVAIIIFLTLPHDLAVLGLILLVTMVFLVVVVAAMSVAAIGIGTRSSGNLGARVSELALQLHANDINVARLAAKVERFDGEGRSSVANVLDGVAQRLNAVENALAHLKEDIRDEAPSSLVQPENALQVFTRAEISPWEVQGQLSPTVSTALEMISQRLHALERNGLIPVAFDAETQFPIGQFQSAMKIIADRLNALEQHYGEGQTGTMLKQFAVTVAQCKSGVDVLTDRMNALERNARDVPSGESLARVRAEVESIRLEVARAASRLDSQEELLDTRVGALDARLNLAEEQAVSQAENVERISRHQA